MRAFMVLLALVTTPFLAGASQAPPGSNPGVRRADGLVGDPPGLGHDAPHCAMRAELHPNTEIINKCDPPADPPATDSQPPALPPDTQPTLPPPPAGTAWATGFVVDSASGQPAPQNWGELDLSVRDDVTLVYTVIATTGTDASGLYTFAGLAGGNYQVCAVPNTGLHQTYPVPPCYRFFLGDGMGAGGLKFRVAPN